MCMPDESRSEKSILHINLYFISLYFPLFLPRSIIFLQGKGVLACGGQRYGGWSGLSASHRQGLAGVHRNAVGLPGDAEQLKHKATWAAPRRPCRKWLRGLFLHFGLSLPVGDATDPLACLGVSATLDAYTRSLLCSSLIRAEPQACTQKDSRSRTYSSLWVKRALSGSGKAFSQRWTDGKASALQSRKGVDHSFFFSFWDDAFCCYFSRNWKCCYYYYYYYYY